MQIIHTHTFPLKIKISFIDPISIPVATCHVSITNCYPTQPQCEMDVLVLCPRRSAGWIEKLYSNIISRYLQLRKCHKKHLTFRSPNIEVEEGRHSVTKVCQLLVVSGLSVVLSCALPRPGLGTRLPRLEQRHRLGRPRQHLHLRRRGEQHLLHFFI